MSRILEIDTTPGPVLGAMTRATRERTMLEPGEVVLTFDDGPMPWITRAILDTLETHCTRATFFSIGKMALAYPATVREVLARGHTLGTHTWSHPLDLRKLPASAAITEIEQGFAAITAAAGQPIAPFFRFPGLNDSTALIDELRQRHIATVTVDVVSNDSYIREPDRIIRETLSKLEANRGGIVLFHDIKPATATALPQILQALTARGFSIVHMVPKQTVSLRPDLIANFDTQVRRQLATRTTGRPAPVPFFAGFGTDAHDLPPPRLEPATARDVMQEDTTLDERDMSDDRESTAVEILPEAAPRKAPSTPTVRNPDSR